TPGSTRPTSSMPTCHTPTCDVPGSSEPRWKAPTSTARSSTAPICRERARSARSGPTKAARAPKTSSPADAATRAGDADMRSEVHTVKQAASTGGESREALVVTVDDDHVGVRVVDRLQKGSQKTARNAVPNYIPSPGDRVVVSGGVEPFIVGVLRSA